MFRQDTTFVIGAGASYEFGLPVGSELARRIKKSALIKNPDARDPIYGDEFFYRTFKRLYPGDHSEHEAALEALDTIHKGMHTAVSIDAFIHRFRKDLMIARMGKMLIALEIIKAENESKLERDRWAQLTEISGKVKVPPPDDVWIGQFLRILLDGITDPQDIGREVNIICFNYDRCIEHYLSLSIAAAFRLSPAEAHEIVERMNIIHPYGTLGELAMMEAVAGNDGKLPFAAPLSIIPRLEDIAKNIRTYTEQTHDPETVEKIHRAMANNVVLVFLGFGFNNQNLDLLRVKGLPGDYRVTPRNIYATGVGIASQVEGTIERRVYNLFVDGYKHEFWKGRMHTEFGLSCSDLLNRHNLNFTSFTERYVTGVGEPTLISSTDDFDNQP